MPRLTEEKWPAAARERFSKPDEDWAWLNSWLIEDEGLGKIKFWAREFLKKNAPVMTGAAAPWTEAKREVIEEGLSRGQLLVVDWLDELRASSRPVVVTDNACVELIKGGIYEGRQDPRLERPATLRILAERRGWFAGKERVSIGLGKLKARLIATKPELLALTPEQLRKLHHAREIDFIDDPSFAAHPRAEPRNSESDEEKSEGPF